MTVLIVNYGMSNLASVKRAFEACGAAVRIDANPESVRTADRIVIPGVGAFAAAMRVLREAGWVEAVRSAAGDGIPVLGICLGMQLLAESGEEGEPASGFGLVGGRIERMRAREVDERIPHYGWNAVDHVSNSRLFEGIPSGADFFFAHSYAFVPTNSESVIATTPYCGSVVSAVAQGRVFGVQFHPEKSSRAGIRLIRNFLAM